MMIKAVVYSAGSHFPLGAYWDGGGVNFAMYSSMRKNWSFAFLISWKMTLNR
jgi:hypothetical protein